MKLEVCPICGGELEEWNQGIYECEECGSMIDSAIFDEEVEE